MPTSYPRIAVTRDPELGAALDRAASVLGEKRPSRLLRELALRGAERLVEEEEKRKQALERLARWSTNPEGSPIDFEVLARVREIAWRDEAE